MSAVGLVVIWVCVLINVAGDGVGHEAEVVLEGCPRTLRPVAKAVLELVSNSQRDSVWTGVVQ